MDRQPGHLTKSVDDVLQSMVWIKVVGMGNSACGKTCLIKHFCESKFNNGYQPTVGVDYGFKIHIVRGLDLRVHLWDFSGNNDYLDVRNELYGDVDAAFIVFDVTNMASFENLESWVRELKRYDNSNPEVTVVANKIDMKSKRVVSTADAKRWAGLHNFSYYETSCSTGEAVEKMFTDLLTNVIQKRAARSAGMPLKSTTITM